ncbi:methylamine utilization protein MauE [Nonomuraea turkmeniaca]|uniref:Methylamine utilization protein MauE n=1 Tax=Nonomuraea turkmeniaca TaxID=103838 RepID=A0A5S4FNY1_9ACTN|nr:MauE/DoxX family redox-associated membrane protein [Nonomuraea turkmeniaca]TMR22378.1 methylamine utilization protein MauE [Nonomuraea turkmeniaca]
MAHVLVASQVLLTTVFVVSAYSKLRSRAALQSFAATLRLLPGPVRFPAAMATVAMELVAAATLIVLPHTGLAASGMLLIAFSIWIAVSLRWGRREPCQCFGVSATPLGPVHLIRNGVLLLVVALGWVTLMFPGGPVTVVGLALAVPVGLVGAILLIVFDDIADLFMEVSGSA